MKTFGPVATIYEELGVREVLIVDRAPWSLVLYRLIDAKLECAARVTPGDGSSAASAVVPLSFQLVAAEPRPKIVVTHHDGRQRWEI